MRRAMWFLFCAFALLSMPMAHFADAAHKPYNFAVGVIYALLAIATKPAEGKG